MIDLHYWPTANGQKVSIALAEIGLPYRVVAVDIEHGAQFDDAYGAISPNHKIPAIVDTAPADGGAPVTVFESAAILQYLAEKSGQLLPTDVRGRFEAIQWTAWQVAGLGPAAGQAHHFMAFAPEKIPYAIQRFSDEVRRLCGVLDARLAQRAYVAGAYSIADIAAWPWVRSIARQLPRFDAGYPNVSRWITAVGDRPAVQRGLAVGASLREQTASLAR